MSDFVYSHSLASNGRMDIGKALVGKSTKIYFGDVLVLDQGNTYSASNIPVLRPLLSSDTITVSNGIAGVALFDMETNSSAKPITVTSPVTVDTKSQVQYALPSIAHALRTDPDTGYTEIYFAVFSPTNVFAALTEANDVADYYLTGRAVGITASAASFPANYTVNDDAAAANAPLSVVGVDERHAQFNSANGGGRVFVVGRPTFYQYYTGTFHST